MNRSRPSSVFFIFFCSALSLSAFMVSSCGYSLVREGTSELPGSVGSLSVPLAENRTLEAGIEDEFTNELIRRLRADGRIDVKVPGHADAALECTVHEVRTSPAGYSEQGRVSMESVFINASCKLIEPGSRSLIWSSGPLSETEEYPVSDDYLLNEKQKAAAINQALKDISETVRGLLLDGF